MGMKTEKYQDEFFAEYAVGMIYAGVATGVLMLTALVVF